MFRSAFRTSMYVFAAVQADQISFAFEQRYAYVAVFDGFYI